jgi:hypothetical protein
LPFNIHLLDDVFAAESVIHLMGILDCQKERCSANSKFALDADAGQNRWHH